MRAVAAAALLLVPAIAAEHVYSHRFVFGGRLLGANGLPVAGVPVQFYSVGGDFSEPCHTEPDRSLTDEWGDFSFCYHVHELQATTRVGVRAGNATVEKPMDTAFRRTSVVLRLDDRDGEAPPAWNETHRIMGKVWRHGPTNLEGVFVYGTAIVDAPVNLSLRLPDGARTSASVTTNGYGDFEATFRLATSATAGDVQVVGEAFGQVQVRSLDLDSHVTTLGFILPRDARLAEPSQNAEPDERPGGAAPRVPPALPALVGVAAVAMLALRSRKKEP